LTSGSSSIALRRSVSTASATPGYWTFTATSSPSIVVARWTCPIDAAANARSSNSEKTRLTGPPNSSQPLELRERNRRDVVAEFSKLCLQRVALVLGKAVELDHREHLPDLHRRPPHPSELLDELVDERGGALILRGGGALRRADAIGRPHARPPHALPGHQTADPRGPRDPSGRQLSRFRSALLGFDGHRQSVKQAGASDL
jgi:hypothetical protein